MRTAFAEFHWKFSTDNWLRNLDAEDKGETLLILLSPISISTACVSTLCVDVLNRCYAMMLLMSYAVLGCNYARQYTIVWALDMHNDLTPVYMQYRKRLPNFRTSFVIFRECRKLSTLARGTKSYSGIITYHVYPDIDRHFWDATCHVGFIVKALVSLDWDAHHDHAMLWKSLIHSASMCRSETVKTVHLNLYRSHSCCLCPVAKPQTHLLSLFIIASITRNLIEEIPVDPTEYQWIWQRVVLWTLWF